jgi:hypothetical protein
MIALTLVRVIERHSTELAAELVKKLGTSPPTTDLRKVPVDELRRRAMTSSSVFLNWGSAARLGSRSPTSAGQLL